MSVQLFRSGTLAPVTKESGVEKHTFFAPMLDSASLVRVSNSMVRMHISLPLAVGRSATLACMMDDLPTPGSTTGWYDEPRITSKKLSRLHA